jgi:hypothetical protein
LIRGPRLLPRRQHHVDRGGEVVEAVHADHGGELARHRRLRRVLDHGRAADHQVSILASGPHERLAHRRVPDQRGAVVDLVAEHGGEDDAAERPQPGHLGSGQGRGLAAGQRRIGRHHV